MRCGARAQGHTGPGLLHPPSPRWRRWSPQLTTQAGDFDVAAIARVVRVVGRWYDRLGTARHGTARAGMPRRTEPHHGMPGLGTLRRHATAWPGSGRYSSVQLGPARPRSARLGYARPGSATLGSACLGPVQLGLTQPGSVGSTRLRPTRLGTARHGTARHDTAQHGTARHGRHAVRPGLASCALCHTRAG